MKKKSQEFKNRAKKVAYSAVLIAEQIEWMSLIYTAGV